MATILLVDDNELFRATLRTALERAGHAVLEAENGHLGLQVFGTAAIEVVVTDIFMPDSDGIELIRHIRRSGRAVPIVAMSGGARSGHLDALDPARKLGASVVLSKPFAMADLVSLVGQLLEQAQVAKR